MTTNKHVPVQRKAAIKKKRVAKKKQQPGLATKWKVLLAGIALILLSPFYYGYVLQVFSSTWRWVKDIGQDPNYRNYDGYNIQIPSKKYSIHGIDVSYYQGKINWEKVKEMKEDEVKVGFAFIKATEGVTRVDPYFQRNWREAPKAGIVCGAYHYFKPSKSGKWQARFFLQNVKPEKGDLPMVVDIEELNGVPASAMRKELMAFIKHIEDKTLVKPIIYTNLSFYKDYLKGYADEYPLWIAHYYKAELKVDKETNWKFWQHSDKATIDGINHVVDMNVFNGDSIEFRQMLIK
ncbi:glycoside hydrolase family 25 protein [Desertivirga xinjiangensis]|uniref:glycoside hydrolase family 25 protein n=1 Tax=Desertivirga xinjiangensis TaxID=539206 RepID=UPI002109EC73